MARRSSSPTHTETQPDDPGFDPDNMPAPEFVEVPGEQMGELFKFEIIGDTVEGIFKKYRSYSGQFGTQRLYDIETAEEELITLTGNFDLNSKMNKVRPGSRVRVEYVEDKDTGQASPMRIFKVSIARAGKKPARTEPTRK